MLKESWINNTDQINIIPKDIDYYCYLSNYKEKKEDTNKLEKKESYLRKKSAPKAKLLGQI